MGLLAFNVRILAFVTLMVAALAAGQGHTQGRTYATSFESVSEFSRFYIVPQNYMGTSSHDLSSEVVRSGRFSHKAWMTGPNPASRFWKNNNHRGYPTIQLYKLPKGAFKTPVKVVFWVWLDMDLSKGEWFSFATLDHTTSNRWDPVLVNLSDEGFVHLMHIPVNGDSNRTFQTDTIKFPMRQWVELTVLLHFDAKNGYARVFQNRELVSSGPVRRGDGWLTQAHFGLYAPPSMTEGVVFNDDLVITEISGN